jgi:hypothetical protein
MTDDDLVACARVQGDQLAIMLAKATQHAAFDLTRFPIGWPRPTGQYGDRRLPIPYNAGGTDHSAGEVAWKATDPHRMALTAHERRCQVCAEVPSGPVWILRVREGIESLYLLDAAPICQRCYPVAARHCPHLADYLPRGLIEARLIDDPHTLRIVELEAPETGGIRMRLLWPDDE